MPPIRIVSVGGKTIAVRDEETHAVGIAVPAHANPGAVLERDFESHARRRNFKLHRRSPPADFSRRPSRWQIKAFAPGYGDAGLRGQRLIPDGNQGFVCWKVATGGRLL